MADDDWSREPLDHAEHQPKQGSLLDLTPWPFPVGSERLSEEVDRIVYGS